MSLSEWAGRAGVSRFTAYRWFREGTSPVPVERAGRLILVNGGVAEREPARTVVYARVSSDDQRSDLERQVALLTGWAAGQGMAVAGVAAGRGRAGDERETSQAGAPAGRRGCHDSGRGASWSSGAVSGRASRGGAV